MLSLFIAVILRGFCLFSSIHPYMIYIVPERFISKPRSISIYIQFLCFHISPLFMFYGLQFVIVEYHRTLPLVYPFISHEKQKQHHRQFATQLMTASFSAYRFTVNGNVNDRPGISSPIINTDRTTASSYLIGVLWLVS